MKHEDDRVVRLRSFMLEARLQLRNLVNAYSVRTEKELDQAFHEAGLGIGYKYYSVTPPTQEGLDIDLDKELPEFRPKFEALARKIGDVRAGVLERPEVKSDQTYSVYLREFGKAMRDHPEFEQEAIRLLGIVEVWLRKHS